MLIADPHSARSQCVPVDLAGAGKPHDLLTLLCHLPLSGPGAHHGQLQSVANGAFAQQADELTRSRSQVILPMSTLKGRTPFWGLLANWTVVFFGNLAGALFYVAFMGEPNSSLQPLRLGHADPASAPFPAHWSGLYSAADLQEYSRGVSVVKTSIGFGPCVIRGIG